MSTHEAGRFNIRARSKEHLEALIAAHQAELGRCKIIETPAADYRWRIMLAPKTWEHLAAKLAAEVDYSNFKNECHKPGAGADDIGRELMAVWSTMNRYQHRKHQPQGEDGFGGRDLWGWHGNEDWDHQRDYEPEIEPEPEIVPFDYSALEHDLQQAGSRGLFVRPALEELPDDWQEELRAWIDEPLTIEEVGDDAFAVKITEAPAPEVEPELLDEPAPAPEPDPEPEPEPAEEQPHPASRKAALGKEQQKIDALLAEEREKSADGQLHDRGPGDKPHRPDFGDQKDPELGIVQKDGTLHPAQRAKLPGGDKKRFCQACGAEQLPDAKHCHACGAEQPTS